MRPRRRAAHAVIERLLPAVVASAEARETSLDVELFPEEERALGAAVGKRRQEFVTGRACARRALRELGIPPAPIASGSRGEPLWPAGVVGSITHCERYVACAAARERDVLALGVDAEPNRPLPAGVLARIASGSERDVRVAERGVCVDTLLFSAKEAVYKAWFPLTGRWLSFDDVRVSFDSSRASFVASLCLPAPVIEGVELSALEGNWCVEDNLILTGVALPRRRVP